MAIVPNTTDLQVTQAVDHCLNAAGISGYNESHTTLSTSPSSGTALTVTASVPWSSVSWFTYTTWIQGQTLSGSAVMIKE